MATINATSIFKSTTAIQEVESNNLTAASVAGATSISFRSDPDGANFVGNNVNGILTYTAGGVTYTINGIVSRLFKSGGDVKGFYFIDTGNDYALANAEVSNAYILTWPGKEAFFAASPGTYGTSSDPVDSALNSLLNSADNGPTINTVVGTTVVEGNNLVYTVNLSGNTTFAKDFSLTKSGTSAPADYNNYIFSNGVTYDPVTGKITVPVGVNSFTITAPTVDDALAEPSETLILTLGGVSGTGTITDNDSAGAPTVVSVTVTGNSVVEGNSLAYTVTLSGATVAQTQMALAASGTAQQADYGNYVFSNGVTYDAQTGMLTIPVGVTSFTITAPTIDDTAVEATETLTLTVGGVAGTGNITDNDVAPGPAPAPPPTVAQVTAEDAATPAGSGDNVVEEGGALRYTVTLSGASDTSFQLPLAPSGTAQPVDYSNYTFSNGVTYNATTGTLTIPAGVSSFTIIAPTVDDTAVEPTETLALSVGGISATGTITDNDAIAVAAIVAEDAASAPGAGDSIVEEGGALRYAITLSDTTVAPVQLSLTAGGTAQPIDYSNYTFSNGVTYDPATGTVTIPAGVSNFTITTPTLDDAQVETPETLALTLGGITATGTITDNDVISVAGVTAADAASPAGSGDSAVIEGGTLRYEVSLSGTTIAPVQIDLAKSGTAQPVDYANFVFSNGVTYDPTTGKITIPAGVNSFTIFAPSVDDSLVEATETLDLTIGGVTAKGTITDNDVISVAGVVAEDAASAPGAGDDLVEEGGALRYTVSLNAATIAPVQLDFAASGSAQAADYANYTFSDGVTYDPSTGKITIPAGVNTFTVTAPTIDDSAVEPAETLDLTIGGVTAKGTITDNDVISVAGIVAEDAASPVGSGDNVVEEGGALRYAITLSDTTIAPTQLTLSAAGSAQAADYANYTFSNGVTYDPATGQLTIPAGVNSFTITAPTVDDRSVEAAETLDLTVGGVAASGIITDNDVVSISGIQVEDAASPIGSGDNSVEEGGSLRYTIALSDPTIAPVQFDLAKAGSALPADYANLQFSNGVTYDPATGKITVPAGVADFSIIVPTVDDTAIELPETLSLTIGGVAGTGTITDNDAIAVAGIIAEDAASPVGSGDDTVEEGGQLRYTISLNGVTVAPVQLPFGAAGSAQDVDYSGYIFSNGVTYDPATGKITIPAGVDTFTVTAPTIDDRSVETTETLDLTIGGITVKGSITDNDVIAVTGVIAEDAASAIGSGDDVVEEGGSLRYTITLSDTTVAPIQLPLGMSGTADPADYANYVFSNGVTYDPATGTITVPAGVSAFTITAPTIDDAKVELAESLSLTVGGVRGTGTITDNDAITVAGVTAEDAAAPIGSGNNAVVEGGTLRYEIALSGTTVAPVQLDFGLSGTAQDADYSQFIFSNGVTYDPATGKITVPAGVNSFTVLAPTVDDLRIETPETLILNVGGVGAVGTITDNDAIAVATVTAEDASSPFGSGDDMVIEGAALRFNIALNGTTIAPVQIAFGTGGTAQDGDYSAFTFSNGVTYDPATWLLTIPAGVDGFTIIAPTLDDRAVEPAESLVVTVGGVAATGTIIDNDQISVASVKVEDAASPAGSGDDSVIEGGTLRYTIALSDTTIAPVQLDFGAAGTAQKADYTGFTFSDGVTYDPLSGKITIPAGVNTFTVLAPTKDDSAIEAAETLDLSFGGVAAKGIIIDNDSFGILAVTPAAPISAPNIPPSLVANAVEEGGALQFSVTLSSAVAAPTQFSLGISGAATPPDYQGLTFSNGVTYDAKSGLLTVGPGVTQFSITVPTIDDRMIESAEAMVLNVGGISGRGLIIDNDQPLLAYYQPFTDDWFYAPAGVDAPYACYELVGPVANHSVLAAQHANGQGVHCFVNSAGQTSFVLDTNLHTVTNGLDMGVVFRLPSGLGLADLGLL